MGGVLPNNFDNHVTRLIMMRSKPNYIDVVFVFCARVVVNVNVNVA